MQIRKSKQPKIQQNKTTLVQLPLTTLGQETRWAYSTTASSPHGWTVSASASVIFHYKMEEVGKGCPVSSA